MAEARQVPDPLITVDWAGDDVHLRVYTGRASIDVDVRVDLTERLISDLQRAIAEIRHHRALKASGQVSP